MRLLFVHERFGNFAGAEANIFVSASALKDRGHSVAIAHGIPTGAGEAEWRRLFHDRFVLADGKPEGPVPAAIGSFQPDAVYVHKLADVRVIEALLRSGRPLVRMVHDHDLYCLRSYKYFPLSRRICSRAAGLCCVIPCGAVLTRNRAGGFPLRWQSLRRKKREIEMNRQFHRLIVATEYMKQELLRNGFAAKRIEIHAPVPPPGEVEAADGSSRERDRIVYAGQIIRGKGVDVLIESLARVRQPFECLIVGDGSHRPHCERLTRRLGLSDRIRFTGYLPPAEVRKHYAAASLVVVSSVWPEPFGAVGIEAMRCAVPVVAFDAGGIREWLRDGWNGYLVPWMDRTEFAARVEQLLREPDLARELGECGRRFAQEKFNFDDYISGLEAMFARVVAETAPALATTRPMSG